MRPDISAFLSIVIAGLLYVVVPRRYGKVFLVLVLTGAVVRIAFIPSTGGWAYFAFLAVLLLVAGFLRVKTK